MEELPRDPAHPLIRRAAAGDLPGACALWLALTRHHAALDPLFALRERAGAEAERLLGALLCDPASAVLLAGEGPPEALAIVRVDRAPPIHPETCRGEISDLYVAPASRRRGLGRALAGEALRWARERGARRVEVRVSTRNPEGQAFWRALGYAPHMDVLDLRM